MQEAPFWRNSPTHYKKLWYCILFVTSSRHSFFFLFVAVSTILICYLSLVFINSSCCSLVLVESLYQLLVINYQLSTICYSYLSSIIIDIYDLLICRHGVWSHIPRSFRLLLVSVAYLPGSVSSRFLLISPGSNLSILSSKCFLNASGLWCFEPTHLGQCYCQLAVASVPALRACACGLREGIKVSKVTIVIISTTLFWDVFPKPIDCFFSSSFDDFRTIHVQCYSGWRAGKWWMHWLTCHWHDTAAEG